MSFGGHKSACLTLSSSTFPPPPRTHTHRAARKSGDGGGGRSFLGREPRTWLLVADPGTFSGTPENQFYLGAFVWLLLLLLLVVLATGRAFCAAPHQTPPWPSLPPCGDAAKQTENLVGNKPFPRGSTSCPDAQYGTIMGIPVAVITTGIGPLAAALCVYDVMESFGPLVKEIIFGGTSGWSPQVGGVLNAGACGQANREGRVNRVGDVCVSPFSVNWDCRKASWTMTAKDYEAGGADQCSSPEQRSGPSDTALFGQCMFADVTPSQLALSDEVLAAATAPGARRELPPPNAQVVANQDAYWSAMRLGTGVEYPPYDPAALPRVSGYTECAEIDSQYFWSGAPWDIVARSYVASTLVAGLPGSTATPESVTAVSAMEAIGLAQGLLRFYAKRPRATRRVPFTVVRGMSDSTMQPVARAAPGSPAWVNGVPVPPDFANGYA
jgi:hypothetical protein